MSERMLFCLGDGKYESKGDWYQKNNKIFNQDVSEDEFNKIKNSLDIEIQITKWIDKKDMTDDEKENKSGWEQTGGFLKIFSYEDAWKNWWNEATQKQKDSILDIKQFNAEIFKGITGIDVSVKEELIDIDGKKWSKSTIKEALKHHAK